MEIASPEALADKMIELLGSPELRRSLGEAAYGHVMGSFRLETQLNKLEAYFGSLLFV